MDYYNKRCIILEKFWLRGELKIPFQIILPCYSNSYSKLPNHLFIVQILTGMNQVIRYKPIYSIQSKNNASPTACTPTKLDLLSSSLLIRRWSISLDLNELSTRTIDTEGLPHSYSLLAFHHQLPSHSSVEE